MPKRVQYSFNFDLNQKLLGIYYDGSASGAYKEIKIWMKKHDVEHRQGSGYNTTTKITQLIKRKSQKRPTLQSNNTNNNEREN